MKRAIATASAVALIAAGGIAFAAPASAATVVEGPSEAESCTREVIYPVFAEEELTLITPGVPEHFEPAFEWSETRATGHYAANADGSLHIWTEGATSTDKVALYRTVNFPLAGKDTAGVNYASAVGITPGSQVVIDIGEPGGPLFGGDGILVHEPVYGNVAWLSNNSAQALKDAAPNTGGGYGSNFHGTLAQWSTAFPEATIVALGFSLGSGVLGDGTVTSVFVGGESRTFTKIVPATKDVYEWVPTGETSIEPPAGTDTVRWVQTEDTEVVVVEGTCYEQVVATDWAIDYGGTCEDPIDIYTRTLTGERWMETEGEEPLLLASWDEGIDTKETVWTDRYWNFTCGIPVELAPQEPVWVDECGTENDGWVAPEPRSEEDVWLYEGINDHGEVPGDDGAVQAFLPEGYYIAGDGPMSGYRYWYPMWELSDVDFTDEPCPVTPAPPTNGGTTGTPSNGGVFGLASTGAETMPLWVPFGAGFLILAGGLAWFFTRKPVVRDED